MNRRLIAFIALALILVFSTGPPAMAGPLLGATVQGTLAFGPNGANGGQFWPTTFAVVGGGEEFCYVDSSNMDCANWGDGTLTITDKIAPGRSANGFEMTFKGVVPVELVGLTLVASNFGPALTFDLTPSGVLKVDWLGVTPTTFPDGRWFQADFNIAAQAIICERNCNPPSTGVPEPGTLTLFGAGLIIFKVLRRRKRKE